MSTLTPPQNTRLVVSHFRAELTKLFTERDMTLYCYCEELMSALLILPTGLIFNCHTICRAMAIILPELSVRSGGYQGYKRDPEIPTDLALWVSEHSWLETPDGAIIDPNPVGFITWRPVMFPAPCAESLYTIFGANMYDPTYEKHGFENTEEDRRRIDALVTFWKGLLL